MPGMYQARNPVGNGYVLEISSLVFCSCLIHGPLCPDCSGIALRFAVVTYVVVVPYVPLVAFVAVTCDLVVKIVARMSMRTPNVSGGVAITGETCALELTSVLTFW